MKVSQNTMAKVYGNTPFFTVYIHVFKVCVVFLSLIVTYKEVKSITDYQDCAKLVFVLILTHNRYAKFHLSGNFP